MASIRKLDRVEYLHDRHTIGRAASCELVLDRPAISGHHAIIRWVRDTWTLRDLNSRNGTYLNGRRLGPQDGEVELAAGDQLSFAESDERWELIDASEPTSMLIPQQVHEAPLVLDPREVLVLPSPERPLISVFLHDGCWKLEQDGDCTVLTGNEVVSVDGHGYRVHLALGLPATSDVQTQPIEPRVKHLFLRLQVAADEESASGVVQLGAEQHPLPNRSFMYLLVFLARQRLADAAQGIDGGWVDVEQVCTELQLASSEAVSLLVHRCRQAIKTSGVHDPAEIIDRSRRGLLRIGLPAERLEVSTSAE